MYLNEIQDVTGVQLFENKLIKLIEIKTEAERKDVLQVWAEILFEAPQFKSFLKDLNATLRNTNTTPVEKELVSYRFDEIWKKIDTADAEEIRDVKKTLTKDSNDNDRRKISSFDELIDLIISKDEPVESKYIALQEFGLFLAKRNMLCSTVYNEILKKQSKENITQDLQDNLLEIKKKFSGEPSKECIRFCAKLLI